MIETEKHHYQFLNMNSLEEMREYIEVLEDEVARCHHNEILNEENNDQFNDWTDEFLILNGLGDYVKPLHDFISDMMEAEDD